MPYGHTAKQADLPHAFMRLLGFHTGAQGIHLVIIAMSIECKHHVCVIGLLTSCMVKSSSNAGRRREGNHPPASSCKNCPRMTCREANTLRPSVVNVMQGVAQQLGQPEQSEQSEQVCTIM